MEKPRLTYNQSLRNISKNRINLSSFLSPNIKSPQQSLTKNKPKRSSLKNIMKPNYLMKNFKKGQESSMYKTSVCTPVDTTVLMSCVSTPNSKSIDKRSFGKYFQKVQKNEDTQKVMKENFMSTCEGRSSQDSLKIVFYFTNNKKIQKFFNFSETLKQVREEVCKIEKAQRKHGSNYGVIHFYSMQNNIGVDKLLSNHNLSLQQFKNNQIFQLSLKVVISKKEPIYKNLELSDFQLMKFLGNGGFSSVFLARSLIDGNLCALKFIKKSSIVTQSKYRMLENEKNILFTIDHPRLVDLYYAFQSKNYIIFGLEFCPNGNLYELMQKRKTITENEGKFLFTQILQGLNSLHSQKILFRDIKLENILFDEEGNVKITDFGLSKPQVNQQDITYSYCGSPQYMAPQMLAKTGHTIQIDHYALGILLYELLFGRSPFYALKKQDIFYAIMNSEPKFPKNIPVSKQAKDLIHGLLQKNPKKRIGSLKGTQQIMSHPWLRSAITTQPTISPFKIPIVEQNIQIKEQQIKKISAQFSQDLNQVLEQKVFFSKSFVNKFMIEKNNKSIIKCQSFGMEMEKNEQKKEKKEGEIVERKKSKKKTKIRSKTKEKHYK